MTTPVQKRFFYTDPLAAAWMAKHHGMRFWNGNHEIHVLPLVDGEKSERWYVHPDSLRLLEPQVGDCCEWIGNPDTRHYSALEEEEKGDPFMEAEIICIVARNGIVFHWPESEGA